ncbi:MAG: hypothetical protein RR957_07295 [Oscillospiraceae bacterium]
MVGKITKNSLARTINDNKITGVIDVISERTPDSSLIAMDICHVLKIGYVKYIRYSVEETQFKNLTIHSSYSEISDIANSKHGNVMFYAKPQNVKRIADKVYDKKCLYVPILKGIGFDVERAMEYGIPLNNVVEMPSIEGEAAVMEAIRKHSAVLVITDEVTNVKDKVIGAEKLDVPVILTQPFGLEYDKIAQNYAQILENAKEWKE